MEKAQYNQCLKQLIELQYELHSYVISLTGASQDSWDILQNANLRVMELLQDETTPIINDFRAWARKVIFFQVMTWRQNLSRERLLFDSELLEQIATALEMRSDGSDARMEALEYCMKLLPGHMHQAIQERYQAGGSVKKIAQKHNTTPHTITMRLYHARLALKKCITKRLALGGSHE